MRPSSDVLFVSSNRNKYAEARGILSGLGVGLAFRRMALEEVQSGSLRTISRKKALGAHARCGGPVLVEDDGLFVGSLGGFPGPYSAYVQETIGNAGLLALTGPERAAEFVSVVSYCDGGTVRSFEGRVGGTIARRAAGTGWGYDPVFVPEGSGMTFAQMPDKGAVSHRRAALEGFARWHRRQSSG